jgi:RNA polymerase sigma-70 factor (TIGR02943 family)
LHSANHINTTIKEWVVAHSDSLYTWAYHKVSTREVAEDLVQDTFLAAVQSFESFEGKSSPKTWLFSILNRKITDYYRLQARSIFDKGNKQSEAMVSQSDELFDETGGWKRHVHQIEWEEEGHLLDNHLFMNELKKCFGKLPVHWEAAVSAKYLLEKQSDAICQELNITPSNYWQILHRAKLLLKKCLETNWFK